MVRIISIHGHCFDLHKLNDNSIVVDAGACIGQVVRCIRKFSKCKIYVIEPNLKNIRYFKQKNYDNVDLRHAALVGNRRGDTTEFTSFDSRKANYKWWGNIVNNTNIEPGEAKIVKYDVPTIKINQLMKVFNIDHIDFLKMDIEATEYDVLKSMKPEIADKIYQMSIELHGDKWRVELCKGLEGYGFNVFYIDQGHEIFATKDMGVDANDIRAREIQGETEAAYGKSV